MAKLEDRTVFVVGAGASVELGFPSGMKLKNQICKLLSSVVTENNPEFNYTLQEGVKPATFQEASMRCDHIATFLPLTGSIDNYLYTHRKDAITQRVAKMAISKLILDAEEKSPLRTDIISPYIPTDDLLKTWLLPFSSLITDKCDRSVKAVKGRLGKVALIIFNYDRVGITELRKQFTAWQIGYVLSMKRLKILILSM